ncbi:pq loop repeat protein [Anaeramoeba ignava]|uniref:Pq loop repeat protein n=1 Tax=Anaeramoeba ignava TaxID=1746090 RepID=A0A9Q0LFX2_ANAIG|nr:pq loop repeat protein [Anaeramoeba ignava]
MSIKQNLSESKIELAFHFLNIFAWFFQIGGLGSFSSSISKHIVLYFFSTIFSLLISVSMIILRAFDKLTPQIRKLFSYFISIIIVWTLYGAQNIYTSYCIAYRDSNLKCQTSSPVFVFGATFSFIALMGVLIENVRIQHEGIYQGFTTIQPTTQKNESITAQTGQYVDVSKQEDSQIQKLDSQTSDDDNTSDSKSNENQQKGYQSQNTEINPEKKD